MKFFWNVENFQKRFSAEKEFHESDLFEEIFQYMLDYEQRFEFF